MRLSSDIWEWSKFCRGSNSEKSETGPISWTFWYILITLCMPITIDMVYTKGLPNLAQEVCKMTFNIGRSCAELQILKKWKWLNWVDYCVHHNSPLSSAIFTLHTHWYWQDVAQVIVKCHLGLAEALPRFKFWKKQQQQWNWSYLETFWIFW